MGWVSGQIGRRTFRFWAIAAVLVVSMAALAGGIAYGTTASCSNPATLSGSAFEVDTNANLVFNTAGCIDWLTGGPTSVNSNFRTDVITKNDKASGSTDNAFGQGTDENDANPTVVLGSIPPNKSDLKAFGLYTENGEVTTTNPTGKNLALFWSRVQNPSGTTNMDFELNQKFCNPSATPTNCANNGNLVPPEAGTPVRTTGDKLITYDLSNGGTVPTISIRTWNGSAWGSATLISGGANPQARGSVNTTTIPATQTGGATNGLTTALGQQDAFTFGEATISFSALFGQNTCGQFGSAYLKSRSSDSFSAALKDFVAPQQVSISNCAGLTTNASNTPNTTDPPATIGDSISDVATLSGVSPTAGGTITFKVYGPNDANCTGTVFDTKVVNVSGPGNYPSGAVTPTAVGTYRWTADYSGDPSNQSASSGCNAANESSLVIKASPQIETTPQPSSGTVGTTLNDSAALTGGVTPTGSIVFNLYAPGNTDCSGTPVFTQTVNVNNGNGTYSTTGGYTSIATGTYRWTASYGGDLKNNSAVSGCQAELVTIGAASPQIQTTPQPSSGTVGVTLNDSASLTQGVNPQGNIVFRLYEPGNDDCSGDPVFSETVPVNGNGTYNTTDGYTSIATGTYRWTATYTSSNTNNSDAVSGCQAEQVTISPASPEIVTDATDSVTIDSAISDTATLSGGVNPTGTITFNAYGPDDADCSGPAAFTRAVDVDSGNGTYNSGDFTPLAVGTYRWTADYSGDDNNDEASSPCNAPNESSLVNQAPANIETVQELFPQDSAALSASAGGPVTGDVTFKLFATSDCSGTPVFEQTVELDNEAANTNNTTFSVDEGNDGDYKWLVTYSGDDTHEGATSACGKEAFTATVDDDTTN